MTNWLAKPGKYYIGREYSTGKHLYLTVHDSSRCGWDCTCCEFSDGTAPADHARDCDVFGDWAGLCDCEGAEEKALERKRDSDG